MAKCIQREDADDGSSGEDKSVSVNRELGCLGREHLKMQIWGKWGQASRRMDSAIRVLCPAAWCLLCTKCLLSQNLHIEILTPKAMELRSGNFEVTGVDPKVLFHPLPATWEQSEKVAIFRPGEELTTAPLY